MAEKPQSRESSFPVYLLAGGQSRRFGSDKGRAELAGETLLERIAHRLKPIATSFTVVAARERAYADLGLRTIADLRPGAGPLAGLEAALADATEDWVLVSSCDIPDVDPSWVDALAPHRPEHAGAVAFADERWHPTFALYHRELLAQVAASLDDGRRAVWKFLEHHGTAVTPPATFERASGVNTTEDLESHREP